MIRDRELGNNGNRINYGLFHGSNVWEFVRTF
jgi:hypothetical protein